MRTIHVAATRALLFLAILLAGLPAVSQAQYAAIASSPGSNNAWGWATRDTQQLANQRALVLCNKQAPARDCELRFWKALVRADGDGSIAYGWSHVSLQEARNTALSQCGSAHCKVVDEFTAPGFIALARTKENGPAAKFFVAYGFDNSDEAINEAIKGCEKQAKTGCKNLVDAAIAGKIQTRAPSASPAKRTTAEAPSCRPTTATVRCTSQCTNGNCVIKYENGCKMHVQVQPQFDPFTNQWTYPAPSC